ncbi:hypothetical protein HAX54_052927 [Datura stramonium]|uniref:Uncharacterized protein n=1 Tax=Datura stramonium TaxID=4076 RepID=A0ABS8SZL2_DATST|nr:hypothetical protein [Datura stramonium]
MGRRAQILTQKEIMAQDARSKQENQQKQKNLQKGRVLIVNEEVRVGSDEDEGSVMQLLNELKSASMKRSQSGENVIQHHVKEDRKYGHKEEACRAKNPKVDIVPHNKAKVVDTKVETLEPTTQMIVGESRVKKVSDSKGWITLSNSVQQKKMGVRMNEEDIIQTNSFQTLGNDDTGQQIDIRSINSG